MSTIRLCAECGTPVPEDAPEGACPACVLRGALALSNEGSEAVVAEKTGDYIGPYKLAERLGEGGCGVVYLAVQAEPICREVALKVIKLGMDTRQVIARFENERQALAVMDHPNIARVFEAGATETGRPYFVMELVRGLKITDYCDQHNLPTRERLDLFMQVCQAVQHAHQKGIIHRDLKPSNILVTVHDGVPVPKVIDFGIAKATAPQDLSDRTLLTAFGELIGTPAYASPEQAGESGGDIDTRSDIYSLGVLLYELLTGRLPFEREELLQAGSEEIRRVIREQEPPKPSTKLSTLAVADLTAVAKLRQAEPPKLLSLVRGDLDWIVMKCLEKDRARRYETANSLTRDLERHLKNEPVTAAAPGALYRIGKFIRRHRVGLATATALVLLLVAGVVVSASQAVRAAKAQRQARTVATFLENMLKGVGPSVARGRDTTLLREILDKTVEEVRKDLKAQPEVEAELLNTIGEVYLQLGEYPQAERTRRDVLALCRKAFGNEHRKVADALNNLANLFFRQSKLAEAEAMHREALAMRIKLLGEEHADVAASLNNLGTALWGQGNLPEAETVLRKALALRKKLFGNRHPEVAESLGNLAAVLSLGGKLPEGEAMQREALALDRSLLGDDHPDVAFSLNNLADMLCAQGKLSEAESFNREALTLRRKVLGNEHPDVAFSIFNLATVLAAQGRLAESESLHRDSLAMRKKLLGTNHLDVAGSLNNLAGVLIRRFQFAEAESVQREALAIQRKGLDPGHQDIAGSLLNLGQALRELGQHDEAEAVLRESLAIWQELNGSKHPTVAGVLDDLAEALRRQGKLVEAATMYREAADQGNADAQSHLARMYFRGESVAKDMAEAARWYRKAADQYRSAAEGGDVSNLNGLAWLLATCPVPELRNGPSAVTNAEKAAEATSRKDPSILNTLAAAYAAAGQFGKAVGVQKEAIELLENQELRKKFASHLQLYESNSPYVDAD